MKLFFLLQSFFFVNVLAHYEDVFLNYFHHTTLSINRAYFMNNITVGDQSGLNGLEHVIDTMVDDINNALEYKPFRKINFLIAVPEKLEIISNLEVAVWYLRGMKELIHRLLSFTMVGSKKDLTMETLKSHADYRRSYIVPALKNRIQRRLLDGPVQLVGDEASLLPKCRLLGVYLSTQSLESYITDVQVDSTTLTCTFTDKNDKERRYRIINKVWTEISKENQFIKSLEQQLPFGYPQGRPTS